MKKQELQEKYSQLLSAVERKFPGETRHEAALKYIRQVESHAIACRGCESQLKGGVSEENKKLRRLLRENCSAQNFVAIWRCDPYGYAPGAVRNECHGCEAKCVGR